jgi:hypothetical protein
MKKSLGLKALTLILFITLITVFLAYRGGYFKNTLFEKFIVQTNADTSIISASNSTNSSKDSSVRSTKDSASKIVLDLHPTKQKRLMSSSKSLILVDPPSGLSSPGLTHPSLPDSIAKLLELPTVKNQ